MNNLIARSMCEVLAETVWPHVQKIVHQDHRRAIRPLVAKVGNAKKTFHRLENNKHHITFGPDYVDDLSDYRRAQSSFGAREIIQHGYFGLDQEVTYPASLAHLILHEAAHAIQTALDLRVPGKQHDKGFYWSLSTLHEECGAKALEAMTNKLMAYGIDLDFNADSFRILPNGKRAPIGPDITLHNPVAMMIKDKRNLGVITQVGNRKSEVYIYTGPDAGKLFNAPNSVLSELTEDDRRPDPEKDIPKEIPWKKGEHCHFYGKDMTYYGGKIDKANKKTCAVLITEGPGSSIGRVYSIPRRILHEGNKQHPSRTAGKRHHSTGMSL